MHNYVHTYILYILCVCGVGMYEYVGESVAWFAHHAKNISGRCCCCYSLLNIENIRAMQILQLKYNNINKHTKRCSRKCKVCEGG